MLKNAAHKILSVLKITSVMPDKNAPIDIYGKVVEGGEDFFHPKKFRGIPVFDVQSIMKLYKPQLDKIKQHVEIGDHRTTPDGRSLYDTLYTSVIERYVEFCHMIPASEDHHHSHTGGLFLHSLEASVDSLRWAKEKHYGVSGFVDIDSQVKPVMNYCAWLAALLHDAGKLMTDISVDAVEVYDKKANRKSPVSEAILSWNPAQESLIEWAKNHQVSSYSVNFLSNRTHNRHNIDSSQILPPLIRNHYAIEYLFSTPIKQEIYSALTSVLSGYSTTDNFLSEAVRMGDSASTSRSLGYLYDAKLGSRAMSTAQRLYRTIRHAAKDWRWNSLDAEGWILGGDVFIRWSATVEDIIKVSVALGYSLPFDVKNVLNIMESNHITDLFDKTSVDDRIVRFTPGQFSTQELSDIQLGKKQKRWNDLLKLRGPEVVFAESPMPFSKEGLIFLPSANTFYVIKATGELTKLPSINNKKSIANKETKPRLELTNDNPKAMQENASEIENQDKPSTTESPAQTKKSKPASATKKSKVNSEPKTDLNNIEVLPTAASSTINTKGIQFSNIPTNKIDSSKSDNKKLPGSAQLQSVAMAKPTYIAEEGHAFILCADIPVTDTQSIKDVISLLDNTNELEMNINNPSIKTVMRNIGGKKQKCIKLSKRASTHFTALVDLSGVQNTKTAPQSNNSLSNVDNHTVKSNVDNKPVKSSKSKNEPQHSLPMNDSCQNTYQVKTKNSVKVHRPFLSSEPENKYYKNRTLSFDLVLSSPTTFIANNTMYLNLDVAKVLTDNTPFAILEFLNAHFYIPQDKEDLLDHIEYQTTPQGDEVGCVLLTSLCTKNLLVEKESQQLSNPDVTIPEATYKVPAVEETTDTQQLDYLVKVSTNGSLLRYISTHNSLNSITENGIEGFYIELNKITEGEERQISPTQFRKYMREHDIVHTNKGYLLTAKQLTQINLSEVIHS